jgi:hypothetical protein
MSSNHSSSIKQFHTFVRTSVTRLLLSLQCLLVSTILFDAIWKVCCFTHPLKDYCTGVVSSVLMSVYAQEEHCIRVVSSVLDILCLGCHCTSADRF